MQHHIFNLYKNILENNMNFIPKILDLLELKNLRVFFYNKSDFLQAKQLKSFSKQVNSNIKRIM